MEAMEASIAARGRTDRALKVALLVVAVLAHAGSGEGPACRIEIAAPETGEIFPAGGSVVIELGLVDCAVPCPPCPACTRAPARAWRPRRAHLTGRGKRVVSGRAGRTGRPGPVERARGGYAARPRHRLRVPRPARAARRPPQHFREALVQRRLVSTSRQRICVLLCDRSASLPGPGQRARPGDARIGRSGR